MKKVTLHINEQTLALMGLGNTPQASITDDQVATGLSTLAHKAGEAETVKAQLQTVTAELNQLKAEKEQAAATEAKTKVTAQLDTLEQAGKITAEQKPMLATIYEGKPAELEAYGKTLVARTPVSAKLDTEGMSEKFKGTFAELHKSGLTAELKRDYPELYKEKFKAQYGKEPSNM